MKCVIFCGGRGTRLNEETATKPKPLIKIGEMPIVEHIMRHYAFYGINDFILLTGYKHEQFEEYFKAWRNVVCLDTGENTMTALRLWQAKKLLINEPTFCLTYGDAVSTVDLHALQVCHNSIVTITGIHPQSQYGILLVDQTNLIHGFQEKPLLNDWINAGYMMLNNKIWEFLDGENIPFEMVLKKLTNVHGLHLFPWINFWHSMDTLKDVEDLRSMWDKNQPWKVWT